MVGSTDLNAKKYQQQSIKQHYKVVDKNSNI